MEPTTSKQPIAGGQSATASHDDLTRILGDVDDAKIVEILALKPTLQELEEATLWVTGDGDVLAKEGHPLGGIVAAIVDIISDEEKPR
jgi:hypothetical protein